MTKERSLLHQDPEEARSLNTPFRVLRLSLFIGAMNSLEFDAFHIILGAQMLAIRHKNETSYET